MTIFEKIINREIPSYIVYEDDYVIAFLDIQQTTKGHTLVVPKEAYVNIFDIPNETLSHLMNVVKKLSLNIKNAFNAEGINLLNNNGSIAGQTVFHFHFHIIPRYEHNDLIIEFTNNNGKLSAEDYKKRASAILAQ